MKQIILFDPLRKEVGSVRLDSQTGRIEADVKKDQNVLEEELSALLLDVVQGIEPLFISKVQRGDVIVELREKIDLKHPKALKALADRINGAVDWEKRIFAVIQDREEGAK